MSQGVGAVRYIVAVASGKGGVGKSTVSANLAVAAAQLGYQVGLLDADIYGPSQARLLGIADGVMPDVIEEKIFIPIEAHGVSAMSMAFLTREKTPMVWRGPMASGALQQMIESTRWGELDVLFVDMPPGTGDIQLTLAQQIPVSGSVVVTTPQDIATLDARKGLAMFRKVNIPVFGVIENMSTHVCSNCGQEEAIFGVGGAERIVHDFDVALLGRLPLDARIREHTDRGKPTVVAEPDSHIALAYREAAWKIGAEQAAQKVDHGAKFGPIVVEPKK